MLEVLKSGQDRLKSVLEAPEFKRRASDRLVRRIEKEAQRMCVMRLQIAGAAKAIEALAEKCLEQEIG
jgi:hypothetical protein